MSLERKETRLFLEPVNILDGVVPFDFARKYDKNKSIHASDFLIDSRTISLEFPPNMSEIYDAYQEEPTAQKMSLLNTILYTGAGALLGGLAGGVIGDIIGIEGKTGIVTGIIGGGVVGALIGIDASKTNVVQSYPLPFRFSLVMVKPYFNSTYEYMIWVYYRLLEYDLLEGLNKNDQEVRSELFSLEKGHGEIANQLIDKLIDKKYVIKNDVNDQLLSKIIRTAASINEGTIVYKNVRTDEEEMEKWNLRSYIKCECDQQIFINEDGISDTEKIIEITPVSVTTFVGKPSDYGVKAEIREHGTSFADKIATVLAGAALGALGGAVIGGAVGIVAAVASTKSFSVKSISSSLISSGEKFVTGVATGAIIGAVGGAAAGVLVAAVAGGWIDLSDENIQLIKIDFFDFIPSQDAEVSLTNIGDLFGAGTEILVNDNFSFDGYGKWCQYNDIINRSLTQGKYGEHFNKNLKGKEKEYPHIVFKNDEYKLRQVQTGGTISAPIYQKGNWEVVEPSTTFKCNFNYVPVDPGTEFINNPPERTRYQKWIGKYNDIIEGFIGSERMHFKRRQNLTDDYKIQGISIDGQSVLKGMEFDETFASVPERLQKGLPLQIDARLENTPFSIMSCFVDCYMDGEKVASMSPFPPESFLEPVKDFFNYFGLGSIPNAASVAVDIAKGALNIPAGAKKYTEYWHGFIPAEKFNAAKSVKIKFVARYGSVYVESDTYNCQIEDNVIMGEIYDRIWTEYNEWQLDNRNRYPFPINPEYGVGETFRDRFEDALKFVDKGVRLLEIVPPGRPVNLRCNVGDNSIDFFWDAPVAPDPQFIKPEELTLDNLKDQLEEAAKRVVEEATGLFNTPSSGTIGILGALDLKEFRVYRKSQYDINWQHIASVDETRYKSSGMEPGVKYEFYVESVDTQGNSSLILDGLFFGLTRGVRGMHFYPMNNEYNTYTVQGTESYANIAKKFDIDEDELKKVNLAPGGGLINLSNGIVISLVRRQLFLKVDGISIDNLQNTDIVIV